MADRHIKVTLGSETEEHYAYDEAIKTLRTNIQFCGSTVKVVMFTSSVPDEGKSSIALSAATSLAQIGKKTLLLDADIRKSVLVSRFQLTDKISGLSEYLSGQKEREDILYETDVENLNIIFAGPYSPNPAELLEEGLFSELIEWARASYDYIVVDTPPMASLIDGAIVASHCDGAVMVIESGAISYRLEQRVKQQLEKSGCRILGVVLNKVSIEGGKYYSKYGKYGRYGRYGKYGKYKEYSRYGAPNEQQSAEGQHAKSGKK
ncbi:MAG: CpsD/CapB family tyrosine-protein kinase [Clostridiales bacterium]|nr:CpsD/CapB family tyrosine-protein kinase [Clostridiales bacterium]